MDIGERTEGLKDKVPYLFVLKRIIHFRPLLHKLKQVALAILENNVQMLVFQGHFFDFDYVLMIAKMLQSLHFSQLQCLVPVHFLLHAFYSYYFLSFSVDALKHNSVGAFSELFNYFVLFH